MRSCAGSGQVACHEAGALLPEGTVTFGEVIGWLADEIETEGRATLARRLVKNRRFAQRRHCWPRACNHVVASAVAAQSRRAVLRPGFPHMVQRADTTWSAAHRAERDAPAGKAAESAIPFTQAEG